jgi:hypothetical protein
VPVLEISGVVESLAGKLVFKVAAYVDTTETAVWPAADEAALNPRVLVVLVVSPSDDSTGCSTR